LCGPTTLVVGVVDGKSNPSLALAVRDGDGVVERHLVGARLGAVGGALRGDHAAAERLLQGVVAVVARAHQRHVRHFEVLDDGLARARVELAVLHRQQCVSRELVDGVCMLKKNALKVVVVLVTARGRLLAHRARRGARLEGRGAVAVARGLPARVFSSSAGRLLRRGVRRQISESLFLVRVH